MQKFPAISQKISFIRNKSSPDEITQKFSKSTLNSRINVCSFYFLPNAFTLILSSFFHLVPLKTDAKFQSKKLLQFPQIFFRFFFHIQLWTLTQIIHCHGLLLILAELTKISICTSVHFRTVQFSFAPK